LNTSSIDRAAGIKEIISFAIKGIGLGPGSAMRESLTSVSLFRRIEKSKQNIDGIDASHREALGPQASRLHFIMTGSECRRDACGPSGL